jgi:hypothetical protein
MGQFSSKTYKLYSRASNPCGLSVANQQKVFCELVSARLVLSSVENCCLGSSIAF